MSQKKLPLMQRIWEERDGSIYAASTDEMRSEFTPNRTVYHVRPAVAFNVGAELARHIVDLHNADLLHKGLGVVPGSTWFGGGK
jgi:hypothetical protein